jgi:POT family proton-dependent oligopeptide transporter
MDLNFIGIKWLPEQIQTVNALLILTLIPLFTFVIYPKMEAIGITPSPLRKFGWGLGLTALTFAFSAWIQYEIDNGNQLNIAWQLLAYVMITVAEILVSITGLEYSFTQAPKSMRSTIMSLFFFTVFLGNFLVVGIHKSIQAGGFFSQFSGAKFFLLFSGIMLANTILYYITVYAFKLKDK